MKEESEKAGLKLSIQTLRSWQIDGEKVEPVPDFIFLGSQIIVDGDCSHGIRRCLLRRKAMTNFTSVLKSRDITLPTKVHAVKAMFFPVAIYRREELDHKEG